jgi:hypothetical protein
MDAAMVHESNALQVGHDDVLTAVSSLSAQNQELVKCITTFHTQALTELMETKTQLGLCKAKVTQFDGLSINRDNLLKKNAELALQIKEHKCPTGGELMRQEIEIRDLKKERDAAVKEIGYLKTDNKILGDLLFNVRAEKDILYDQLEAAKKELASIRPCSQPPPPTKQRPPKPAPYDDAAGYWEWVDEFDSWVWIST